MTNLLLLWAVCFSPVALLVALSRLISQHDRLPTNAKRNQLIERETSRKTREIIETLESQR